MKVRWFSTFNLIGIVLIALGIVGLCLRHFVYDPGQIADGHEPWYYIVVGVLLIVNGLVSLPETDDDTAKADAGKREQKPAEARSDSAGGERMARSGLVSAAAQEQPEQTKS